MNLSEQEKYLIKMTLKEKPTQLEKEIKYKENTKDLTGLEELKDYYKNIYNLYMRFKNEAN